MTPNKTPLWMTAIIAAMFFVFSNTVSAADVIIILNNNVKASDINKSIVKKIYSGYKTKWDNNDSIDLTVMLKSELHEKFLKKYVKKTPSQFKMTWRQMMFTGKGSQPKNFKTIKEVVEYVSKNEGAIGYVSADVPADNVKVIKTE